MIKISKKQYPYKYKCPFCKKPAFFYSHEGKYLEVLQAKYAMQVNGEPKPNTPVICQECKALIPNNAISLDRLSLRN